MGYKAANGNIFPVLKWSVIVCVWGCFLIVVEKKQI